MNLISSQYLEDYTHGAPYRGANRYRGFTEQRTTVYEYGQARRFRAAFDGLLDFRQKRTPASKSSAVMGGGVCHLAKLEERNQQVTALSTPLGGRAGDAPREASLDSE